MQRRLSFVPYNGGAANGRRRTGEHHTPSRARRSGSAVNVPSKTQERESTRRVEPPHERRENLLTSPWNPGSVPLVQARSWFGQDRRSYGVSWRELRASGALEVAQKVGLTCAETRALRKRAPEQAGQLVSSEEQPSRDGSAKGSRAGRTRLSRCERCGPVREGSDYDAWYESYQRTPQSASAD